MSKSNPTQDEEDSEVLDFLIVIDDEKNDDWMKSLPGYQNEVALHDELAKKYESNDA